MEFKDHWDKKKSHVKDVQMRGEVEVSHVKGRLHVICPYSVAFRQGAYPLLGKWRRKSEVWSFPEQTWPFLKALIIITFGEENLRLL